MKKKILSNTILQMMGMLIARCSIMTYNPLGIGYFAALHSKKKHRFITILLMSLSMMTAKDYFASLKNIIIIIGIATVAKVTEATGARIPAFVYSLQTFLIMFICEAVCMLVGNNNGELSEILWSAGVVSVLAASIFVVFSRGIDGIIKGRIRLMQNEEITGIGIMAAIVLYFYGMQNILPKEMLKTFIYGAVMLLCLIPVFAGGRDGSDRKENEIKKEGEKRLKLIEESLSKLADSFSDIHRKNRFDSEDYENIYDELTCKMCSKCARRKLCSQKEEIQDDIYNLVIMTDKKGKLSLQDMTGRFMISCLTPEMFLSELNHIYEKARINMIWGNKLIESRQVISMQLQQIANMICDYGKMIYNTKDYHYVYEDELREILKRDGIFLKKFIIIERKNRGKEYVVTARCQKGKSISAREMAVRLGEYLGVELEAEVNGRKMFGKESVSISFVEKKNFYVLHGLARKTKKQSEISGDNFTFSEISDGKLLMSISDGMGSGYYAFQDSETAVELLEQLMDSGFSEDIAIKMINSVMLINSGSEKPTTLDMGILNLTSGMCDFVKLGAASTFVKRGKWVEAIKSETMPMGVFDQVDIESTSKKMYSGDMIIMVSDGIVEAIDDEDKEKIMSEIILNIDSTNPKEMASMVLENVLQYGSSEPEDDMTVLVAGVWNRAA